MIKPRFNRTSCESVGVGRHWRWEFVRSEGQREEPFWRRGHKPVQPMGYALYLSYKKFQNMQDWRQILQLKNCL